MLASILRLSMGTKTTGHIWPQGHSLPTPDFRKSESKKKMQRYRIKYLKVLWWDQAATINQHTAINMISLAILHVEGILMTGCTLISQPVTRDTKETGKRGLSYAELS